MNQELRLYTFVNFYLSSIQQGIQSAHVVHELFLKYPTEGADFGAGEMLWSWAENHKTMIVLNGGMNTDIQEIFYIMEQLEHTHLGIMPFVGFREDEKSLGNILTSVGVVVPQRLYEAKKNVFLTDDFKIEYGTPIPEESYIFVGEDNVVCVYKPNTPEHTFIDMLKSCSLAR